MYEKRTFPFDGFCLSHIVNVQKVKVISVLILFIVMTINYSETFRIGQV